MLHSCQPLPGKTVRQPLADSICSLIYIDSLTFTFTLTLPEFIYSIPLCDRNLLWFTQYPFSSPYLRCPDIVAGKEREGERENDTIWYIPHIFSSFLLPWETKSVIILSSEIWIEIWWHFWRGFAFLIQILPYLPFDLFFFIPEIYTWWLELKQLPFNIIRLGLLLRRWPWHPWTSKRIPSNLLPLDFSLYKKNLLCCV